MRSGTLFIFGKAGAPQYLKYGKNFVHTYLTQSHMSAILQGMTFVLEIEIKHKKINQILLLEMIILAVTLITNAPPLIGLMIHSMITLEGKTEVRLCDIN